MLNVVIYYLLSSIFILACTEYMLSNFTFQIYDRLDYFTKEVLDKSILYFMNTKSNNKKFLFLLVPILRLVLFAFICVLALASEETFENFVKFLKRSL